MPCSHFYCSGLTKFLLLFHTDIPNAKAYKNLDSNFIDSIFLNTFTPSKPFHPLSLHPIGLIFSYFCPLI